MRVAGLNELCGLGNVFTEDEFVFYVFVKAGMFESLESSSAVGSVVRIGDGDFLDTGSEQTLPASIGGIELGIGGRPENEFTDSIGIGGVGKNEASFVEFAGIVGVGGEEDVKRSTILDLGEEVAGGAESEIQMDAGLFFVSGSEFGQGEFEVGSGGDVELRLLGGGEPRKA